MVCIPCIVIPFVLWVFHKYIQPLLVKFWPWKKQESVKSKTDDSVTNEVKQNGHIETKANGVKVGTASSTDDGGTETKKDK